MSTVCLIMYLGSFTSSKRGSEVTRKHKIITKRPSGSNKIEIKNSLISTKLIALNSIGQTNQIPNVFAAPLISATNYNYFTKIKLYYAVREY